MKRLDPDSVVGVFGADGDCGFAGKSVDEVEVTEADLVVGGGDFDVSKVTAGKGVIAVGASSFSCVRGVGGAVAGGAAGEAYGAG